MDGGAGQGQAESGLGGSPAGVELPADLCAEIRSLASQLESLDCYEVLGVARGADPDQIRAAFFERSRRFHPDRYFNKELGSYREALHEIYKRVVAANEVLRDPELRSAYDASLPKQGAVRFGSGRLLRDPSLSRPLLPGEEPPRAPESRSRPLSKPGSEKRARTEGSSLRARSGLRAPNAGLDGLMRQLEANREKGARHYAQAEERASRQDYEGAVRCARMALAFSPREPKFHTGLAEWLPRVQAARARELCSKGESLLVRGERELGLESLVEAFRILPTDPELGRRVASLARELGRLPLAIEMAECAAALDEEHVGGHKLLGLICFEAGRRDQARLHLQRAWKSDPTDHEVKRALATL